MVRAEGREPEDLCMILEDPVLMRKEALPKAGTTRRAPSCGTCHYTTRSLQAARFLSTTTMSRLSRAAFKARESVFTTGADQYIGEAYASCPPSLEECVMMMEDCCEEVQASVRP